MSESATRRTVVHWRRSPMLLLGLAAVLLLAACGGDVAEEAAAIEAASPAPEGLALDYPKWETLGPGEYTEYNQRVSLIRRGHDVYNKYCVGCHGEYGDGYGPAAERLITRPRDFTSGVYKIRSTDSGSLPMESDLHRTITQGLARVSMPAFPLIPERDKVAVIEYIKTFYPDWEAEKAFRRLVPVPVAPDDLADRRRILRGRVVYLEMQCGQCHGIDGQGTGATQTEYVDAWGDPQKPFNFTRGSLKGGDTPEDIYRTFHTGLRSIMPSYGGETLATVLAESAANRINELDAAEQAPLQGVLEDFPATGPEIFEDMSAEQRLELAVRNSWDLVAYILSLRSRVSTAEAVLGAAGG